MVHETILSTKERQLAYVLKDIFKMVQTNFVFHAIIFLMDAMNVLPLLSAKPAKPILPWLEEDAVARLDSFQSQKIVITNLRSVEVVVCWQTV